MTKKGLSILTQLRVGFSKLNFNKFKHNFDEALNPCARQMVALRKYSTISYFAMLMTRIDMIFSIV